MPPTVMDFFGYQESARRRSRMLVFNFLLAVALTVLAVYAATTGIFLSLGGEHNTNGVDFWSFPRLAVVAGCTIALVLAGTLYKVAELAGGGVAVARLLGGRPVPPDARDAPERRALNVVEEMALAAGTQVPQLYVLDDDQSINAFAAGYSSRDAVVTVTRGTLESLNREELQAVVGHEFSHILNGDMRLNIRLIGLLNGILLLTIVGRGILQSLGHVRSSSKKGDVRAPIMLFAVALIAIGFIGVLFARLIKSAISRQREFLADASSAQFTRNPMALASALRKIERAGATISSPHAEEASHLFFANALRQSWISLFSTHPPIRERIRRLDPHGLSDSGSQRTDMPATQSTTDDVATSVPAQAMAAVAQRVGAPDSRSLASASGFLRDAPPSLQRAAHDPHQVVPLVLAVLLDGRPQVRQVQFGILQGMLDPDDMQIVRRLAEEVRSAGDGIRLPILAIAVPTMKMLSPPQFVALERQTNALIEADRQIDLLEFVLRRMIMRHVEPAFRPVRHPSSLSIGWSSARIPLARLISCMAFWGARDEASARKAFDAAVAELPPNISLAMLPVDQCGLAAFGSAIDELESISFELKRRLLRACVACVASDREVTVEEAELLRAVADSLDCPVPPVFAGTMEATA